MSFQERAIMWVEQSPAAQCNDPPAAFEHMLQLLSFPLAESCFAFGGKDVGDGHPPAVLLDQRVQVVK
jgi:hypothetical protein